MNIREGFLVSVMLAPVACAIPDHPDVMFLSAESEHEETVWSGERSTNFATEGRYSMKKIFTVEKTAKVTHRPSLSVYGGFPVWPNDLWPYREIKLDVYNPQEKTYRLYCCFKDKYQYTHNHYYGMELPPPWPDGREPHPSVSFAELEVKPGKNTLSFSLDEIHAKHGTEWRYIHHYWMWLPEIVEETTLYFDNVRLVRRRGEHGLLSDRWTPTHRAKSDRVMLLYGFESYHEVWQWEWSARKYLVESEGVSQGKLAMKIYLGDLGPKKWEYSARFGVRLREFGKDFDKHIWDGWDRFRITVYNPGDEQREIWLSFASDDAQSKRTEIHRRATIGPGENDLSFPLSEMAAEGLDPGNVTWFELKVRRDSGGAFGWVVLDNMRLTKD